MQMSDVKVFCRVETLHRGDLRGVRLVPVCPSHRQLQRQGHAEEEPGGVGEGPDGHAPGGGLQRPAPPPRPHRHRDHVPGLRQTGP